MNTLYFTIVDQDHFYLAILLAKSLREHHPLTRLVVITGDDFTPNEYYENLIVIPCQAIGITNLARQRFRYDAVEYTTSLRPAAFLYLFEAYPVDYIVHLDADIWILGSLDSVLEKHSNANFVLTPHVLSLPENSLGRRRLSQMLVTGVYNLGFLGCRRTTESLKTLEWLDEHLECHCMAEPRLHQYTDQLIFNVLPALCSKVEVCRDPGMNVAVWNLHERDLSKKEGIWYARGNRLRFLHYSAVKKQSRGIEAYLAPMPARKGNPFFPQHRVTFGGYDGFELGAEAEQLLQELDLELQNIPRHEAPSKYSRFSTNDPILLTTRRIYHYDQELQDACPEPFNCPYLMKMNHWIRRAEKWKTWRLPQPLRFLRDSIAYRVFEFFAVRLIEKAKQIAQHRATTKEGV